MLLEGLWFDKGTESAMSGAASRDRRPILQCPCQPSPGTDIPPGRPVVPLAPAGRFE